MPAFSAAFGSFHVKSSSTSFVKLLVTVRVLPFFLTVTFLCSCTLMVSSLGVRWYTDHRYWSMQMSATRHSSRVSMERTASWASFLPGSGVLAVAICTGGVSGGSAGEEGGKAASATAGSARGTAGGTTAGSGGSAGATKAAETGSP